MDKKPVWIDSRRVDIAAMFKAYQSTVPVASPWCGRLDIFVHRMISIGGAQVVWPASVIAKPCSEQNCFRCSVQQGGYVFRWYHPSWEAPYLELLRDKCCWTPNETAAETAERDKQFNSRQPAHEDEIRVKMQKMQAGLDVAGGDFGRYLRNLDAGNGQA